MSCTKLEASGGKVMRTACGSTMRRNDCTGESSQHLCRLAMALGHALDARAVDFRDEGCLVERESDDQRHQRLDAHAEHDRQNVVDPQELDQDRRVAHDLADRDAGPAQGPEARHVEQGSQNLDFWGMHLLILVLFEFAPPSFFFFFLFFFFAWLFPSLVVAQ